MDVQVAVVCSVRREVGRGRARRSDIVCLEGGNDDGSGRDAPSRWPLAGVRVRGDPGR